MDTGPFLEFSSNLLRLFVSTVLSCAILQAKLSTTMLDSILLINLGKVKVLVKDSDSKERRSSVPEETLNEQMGTEGINSPPVLPESISSNFESSHKPPLATNDGLTEALKEAFSLDGNPPTIEDFETSIKNLAEKKQAFGLSNKSFLSATKSMISAYLRANGEFNSETKLTSILFSHILPRISVWGSSTPNWIKTIAQISVESFLEEERPMNELSELTSSFASNAIKLVNSGKLATEPLNPDSELIDIQDVMWSSEIIPLSTKLESGKTFQDFKTRIIQQLSVGITQGYMGVNDYLKGGLNNETLEAFTQSSTNPTPLNKGMITPNIIASFINGLMDASTEIGTAATQEDLDAGLAVELGEIISSKRELFLYEAIKASANGFLISTTVATTSNLKYLDQDLHLEAAEKVSKQISQSVMLHNTTNNDDEVIYSVSNDWIKPDRIAGSAASGAAMGSQLATVLPKSMDYTDSWEIFTNIRREISKAVSKGSSYGALNASAWLSTQGDLTNVGKSVLGPNDIEAVANGSAMGSMVGNTGLAIYYPTDQLVPIINFTAQGSGYGSLSAENLALVSSDTTESIEVSIARKTALGSSLGASFEPTVLLELDPARNSRQKDFIDHLTAASFGATFGSILGIQNNQELNNGNQANIGAGSSENKIIEVSQSSKQGSIEGALAGVKLALKLDEVNNETLNSKSQLLKAIHQANLKARSNSNDNVPVGSLRTNSKDMSLLMKKFGINPRYTNPAKMYKRPVVVQVDDSPIDEDSKEAISNASPL